MIQSTIREADLDSANYCGALMWDGFYPDKEDCENA
jgi:hypothetical protein